MNSKLSLLIATTAFGLGIDCSDIRRVYHWGPPRHFDSYVQETGSVESATKCTDRKPENMLRY